MGRMRDEARQAARSRQGVRSPSTQESLRRRLLASGEAEAFINPPERATIIGQGVATVPACQAVAMPSEMGLTTPMPTRTTSNLWYQQFQEQHHVVAVMGLPTPPGSQEQYYPTLSAGGIPGMDQSGQVHAEASKEVVTAMDTTTTTEAIRGSRGASRGRRGRGISSQGRSNIQSRNCVDVNSEPLARAVQHRGSGSQGKRGGAGFISSAGRGQNQGSAAAPPGWIPPGISAIRRSPIQLRSKLAGRSIPRPENTTATDEGNRNDNIVWDSTNINSNPAIDLGFITPPGSPLLAFPRVLSSSRANVKSAPGVCRYSIADFTPGPPSPDSSQRLNGRVYRPWEHDCGDFLCTFAKNAKYATARSLREGLLVEDILPGNGQQQVDVRAWLGKMNVLVRLVALGYDPTLWGDLTYFKGEVIGRYYHAISGQPMFTIDFGGSIGIREHLVSDTKCDSNVTDKPATQRTLLFEESLTEPNLGEPSSSLPGANDVGNESLSDPSDVDWRGEYEDFNDVSSDEVPSSPASSFDEVPMSQLGLYDVVEDTTDWTFEEKWEDNQWNEPVLELLGDRLFHGPKPGSTGRPRMSPASPMEYFRQYWPRHTLSTIIKETNRYANQASHKFPQLTNGRRDWVDITEEELLCWFGVLILMGLKVLPNRRMYWDIHPFYNCPIIASVMHRDRFEAIVRCIHLVNKAKLVTDVNNPEHDMIGKVRGLVEGFARMSQGLYNNEAVVTVDEIMVPYKGKYCKFKQYMKGKPTRFGIKMWALASSQSRYVSNVLVYMGATGKCEEGALVGEDAVLQSVRGIEHRGHTVVIDNFFSGVKLFMRLLERGFYATGTVKKGSKGFPSSLAGFPKTHLPPRGTVIAKMHRSRTISAICWIDSKPVWLLSTATNPVQEGTVVGRWIKRERVNFPTSPILLQYQKNMRGVDVVDQLRGNYTVQLQSHKWWHRIFMFIFDSSCLNAYILYQEDAVQSGLPVQSRLQWHYDLALALVHPHLQAGNVRGPHRTLTRPGFHRIEGHPTLRRNCVVCERRTRRFCGGCSCTFMCEGPCYTQVHTQPGYGAQPGFGAQLR